MLITRPNHDETTRYLYFWSKLIINKAQSLKRNVVDLAGKLANLPKFEQFIKEKKPKFIVINGHGDYSLVTGYNNEVLVEEGMNESLLSGKIVFSRSCRSAKKLGKACVDKGTIAYLGYAEDFVFFVEENSNNSLEDNTAKLFLEPSNQIVLSLLEEKTTGAANKESKDMTNNTIEQLVTSEATKEDRELIPYLRWNLTHQVCLGDKKAKV